MSIIIYMDSLPFYFVGKLLEKLLI